MGTEARARLALLGVISVSLLSYGQIFKSSEYVGPAFLGMGLAAILTLVWRRLGLGTKTTFLVMAAALLWYLVLIFQADHSLYGLPTPEALERLAASVDHAYDHIRIDYEPVPVRSGYAVMMVVGVWLATVIGEIAAFRWRRPFLASSPALGLFCVAIVVSDRDHAAFLVMLFLSALLTYWGLASSNSLRSWGRWISTWSDDEGYAASLTGSLARRMGASCVAAALVAPVILPALDEGLLPWRTGGGDGPGGAGGRIDHLVSIKPALLEQSDTELFRVRADRAAYWRLVTLTEFDGEAWWPRGSPTVSVGGGVINAPDVVYEASVDVAQDYRITGLRDEFLPAAVAPATISFEESTDALERTEYNASTGDLGFEGGIDPPLRYSVLSYLPDISYRELADARIASGPDAPDYTVLPPDLAPEVERLARAWTRNAKSPAEKLIAIQSRLREFTYSLDVEPEDSGDYLLDFLTRTRAGYCQQFATAFAVLARSLDFPARVSVGFLPGETSPASPDVYTVRGTDAHAWPEVAFENVGWVAFEPTPRDEAPPPTHTLKNRTALIGATEGTLPPAPSKQLDGPLAAKLGEPLRDPQSLAQAPERSRPPPAWAKAFTRLAVTLIGMMLAFLVCVPIVKSWRSRRRYRRARTPGATAAAAFAHFADEAGELASRRVPSESPRAYVTRIATARKLGRNDALRLASIYEAAAYAAWEVSQQHADEARKLAARLRSRLWTSASWWERAGRLFSPAGLRTSASRL